MEAARRLAIAILSITAPAIARAEPIALVIKQTYEDGAHANVRVDAPVRAFLAAAGLTVQKGAALKLVLELNGSAVSSDYQPLGGGRTVKRWTYATVNGFFELHRGDAKLASAHFYGVGDVFKTELRGGAYSTINQAPYQLAFEESSFATALADAVKPVVDSAHLVRGLEALARASVAESLRLGALCRMTREPDASATERLAELLKLRKLRFDGDDPLKDEHGPRQLALIATIRARRKLASDAERAELARRYRSCLDTGGWCGYEAAGGWCGTSAIDDTGVLEAIGEPAVTELIDALAHGGQRVQERAADRLGALRAKPALEALVKATAEREWSVRVSAARALGLLGEPSARATLEKLAHDDSEQLVRDTAERALKLLPP